MDFGEMLFKGNPLKKNTFFQIILIITSCEVA